ncbi:hypothetical protein ARMGADRAFT_759811 [Armillaria gallica]|uniref:Uncharacterized protein n=1 Tax=Armillaria gallica TaxID=47427 RepID=A0A2H3E6H1_ARMGA|nr:hypothetical protein ARMGADRAFT_759811 [Armillaria gallica]
MQASPPGLSLDERSIHFDQLYTNLNTKILGALLHGLYSGIVSVTLWTISSSPKQSRSTFLRIIIIMLYVLRTIAFAMACAFVHHAFIEYSNNPYSVFIVLDLGPWLSTNDLVAGITGGISTLLVDITIIWRCWTLWDHQWRVVLIPMVCTAAATVMKAMQTFSNFQNSTNDISAQFAVNVNWSLIYAVLMLATTVMCTLLIVYRIVRHATGMSASYKIIEMLVESSALYSISLIVYLALVSQNSESGSYADTIAAYVKVIAPTLLVGRVSAHANASSRRQQMVAMWESHPPLVGCFREEVHDNSVSPDDGQQTMSGSSMSKETA